MRIAFRRWPTAEEGQRYVGMPPTSDRGGPPRAKLDAYKSQVRIGGDESIDAAFERLRRQLFNYAIFSPRVLGYKLLPEDRIAVGCTVVQRLGVGAIFLESATRVVEVWDTTDERGSRAAGFAYVTLQGHPERGVATFEVLHDAGTLYVVLTARSTPGAALTRIASPVTRLVQRSITKRAVQLLTATD